MIEIDTSWEWIAMYGPGGGRWKVREPTFTGPLQVWPMVYILYLFVARGHCTSVYILIQLLLTLLILVLSYIVFVDIVCNGLWKFYGYEFWGFTNCFSKKYGKFICI